MLGWLFGRSNRLRARDLVGNVVVGGNTGIIYQISGDGPPPAPPTLHWAEALPPPGSPFELFNLLSWKFRLARDLLGRDAEKRELLDWARNGPRVRIRFLIGPGGSGKTRLAAEFAEALTGWHAGFVPLDTGATLPLSRRGLLVILDYPEAWREPVRSLLREAARAGQPAAPIRILLLSRRPLAEWREEILNCGASTLCDAQELGIGPLDRDAAADVFHRAVARLAAHRRLAAPRIDNSAIEAWINQNPALHGLPLLTIAAAIHFVDRPGRALGLDAAGIVDALVERERPQLDRTGRSVGLGELGASRLVGLSALRDGLDAPAIRRLVAPELELGLPDAGRVVNALRDSGWWHAERLSAPAPDIVAAELLRQVLVAAEDRGHEWVWACLSDPGAVQIELLDRRMHDMVTLRGPDERTLQRLMIAAVTGQAARAWAWAGFSDSEVGGFRLSPVSVAIGHELLAATDAAGEERAGILNNLSNHLSEAGDGAGALAAIREAVEIRRRLAQETPARFAPDLATSLNNLSLRLSDAGDGAGALAAIREAADIYRRLAQETPARFAPDLAMSLNNLSLRLSDAGDGAGALAAIREAVEICRRLAQDDPGALRPQSREEPQQPVAPV